MAYVIAITGKPGTGKTFVSKCLKVAGMPGWSADSQMKRLVNTPDYENFMRKTFPDFYHSFQEGDRDRFLEHVWLNADALREIEIYAHPLLEKMLHEFLIAHREHPCVWIEVPLLFEAGFDPYGNCRIVTNCSQDIAWKRLRERGWSQNRLNCLWEKYPLLDRYIEMGGDTIDTSTTKQWTWHQVRKRIELNQKNK